jgi:uncharacterized C2H2 Zn-finger protein
MTKTRQMNVYKIDLTRIDGSGDFSCPRCGTTISPDDTTEETYTILDVKVDKRDLEELVMQCSTCASHFHLTGFSKLQEIPEAKEKNKEPRCYFPQV